MNMESVPCRLAKTTTGTVWPRISAITNTTYSVLGTSGVHSLSVENSDFDDDHEQSPFETHHWSIFAPLAALRLELDNSTYSVQCDYVARVLEHKTANLTELGIVASDLECLDRLLTMLSPHCHHLENLNVYISAAEGGVSPIDEVIQQLIKPALQTLKRLFIKVTVNGDWNAGDEAKIVEALRESPCLVKLFIVDMNELDIDMLPILSTIPTLRKARLWKLVYPDETGTQVTDKIIAYSGNVASFGKIKVDFKSAAMLLPQLDKKRLTLGIYTSLVDEPIDSQHEIHLHPSVTRLKVNLPDNSSCIMTNVLQSLTTNTTLKHLTLKYSVFIQWDPTPDIATLLRYNTRIQTLDIIDENVTRTGMIKLIKIYRTLALYNRTVRYINLTTGEHLLEESMELETALLSNATIEQVRIDGYMLDINYTFPRLLCKFRVVSPYSQAIVLYRLHHMHNKE
eukprot:gene3901-4514_t